MRSLSRLAASIAFLFSSLALAQNYTTNITLSNLQAGGASVASAQVCATPADKYGNAIPISAPTWGLVLPNPALCGTVTNGVLTGGLNVPDASHTNAPAPIFYNISIQAEVGGVPVRAPVLLNAVPNITGTSFALDTYTPAISLTAPLSNTVGYGSGVPISCTAPSIWISASSSQAYICVGGSYVSMATGPQGVPGPTGGVSAAEVTAQIAAEAAITSQQINQADYYATQNSSIVTIGSTAGGTAQSVAANTSYGPATPFGTSGSLETVNVNFSTPGIADVLILSGTAPNFTVSSRFTVTAAVAGPTTFSAGTDYPFTVVQATQYIAIYTPTGGAQMGFVTPGPNLIQFNGDPGSTTQTWSVSGGVTFSLAYSIRSFPPLAQVSALETLQSTVQTIAGSVVGSATQGPSMSLAVSGSSNDQSTYVTGYELTGGNVASVTVNLSNYFAGSTIDLLFFQSTGTNTFSLLSKVTVSPSGGGVQTFVAGVDFPAFSVPSGSYVGYYSTHVSVSYNSSPPAGTPGFWSASSSGEPASGVTQAYNFNPAPTVAPLISVSFQRLPLSQPYPISLTIDGGGSPILPGGKGYVQVPYNAVIRSVSLIGDQAGSAVVDIQRCSFAQYDPGTHPVPADSITASDKPTLSSAYKSQDTTLTGWSTQVFAGDILSFEVLSASAVTRLVLTLSAEKN